MTVRKHNPFHYLFVIFDNLFKYIVVSLLELSLDLFSYLIFKSSGSPVGVVVGIRLVLAGS